MASLAPSHCYSWAYRGYLINCDRDFMKFIGEILTIIDQEVYYTGIFIDYLLVKISIFPVKTVDLYAFGVYNISIITKGDKVMTMKPAKMIRKLKKAGFIEVPKSGGHRKFVHPDGRMTEVPAHAKELAKGTQEAILKQAGLK